MMKSRILFSILLMFLLASCANLKRVIGTGSKNEFVRVSKENPRYFETNDGKPWIPVMINFVIPNGNDDQVFQKINQYFRHFSENGGNAMRIWISSPFLEIEDTKVGEYNQVKFKRIDSIISLAKKYDIRLKFTLQHIRSIKPESKGGTESWSNRSFMSVENGGPFKDIHDYITTAEGIRTYLNRVKILSDRYKNCKQIFSWELWNEMDAIDNKEWFPFTNQILDSVKALFPNHLIVQTLGSMHSVDADKRYEKLLSIKNDEYITVHRYLDPGNAWNQYDYVHGPIDLLISNAIQFVYRPEVMKPIVANELGAVEANHSGPNKLYEKDTAGVFIHDMIFTPFFCGTSGCGSLWHWDSYVERQNLWYHYKRFNAIIKGINPIKEKFIPFTFTKDSVRCYGLLGSKTTMIWYRDATSNWKSELQQGNRPMLRNDVSFDTAVTGSTNYTHAKVYDPWNDKWTVVQIKNGKITLPAFIRSTIVILN
ncbi:MAG: glycosyl hydrolase family 5 [Bacteroidota bacterium]|nr:glycosyl hydrolase family 5 [Bacteroidota bacterium]